jgi:putative chitinase
LKAAVSLRTAALAFAKIASGPVLDLNDSACVKANHKLLAAAFRAGAPPAVFPPVSGYGPPEPSDSASASSTPPSSGDVVQAGSVAPAVPEAPAGAVPFALLSGELQAIMPNCPAQRLFAYYPWLTAAMVEFAITTPLRAAAFLAQLAHESGELRYMEEIASGSAYEGRHDLGNTEPGDGVRYKGRGPIQLTGRANYRACGAALGLDLEGDPWLAADPQVAFRIAGWYWSTHACNALADSGSEAAFRAITREINGGLNGLASRERYYALAKEALGA